MKLYGALEAGGTKMVCAIGNSKGEILEWISIPTRTPEETIPQIISFFRQYNICSLGIGCFGPIGLNRTAKDYGYITSTPKLAWQNYPIVQTFELALGIPVGFDTDVNASALGEATWGCAKDVKNSIYITIGTGIGVGVILNGKPHHGMLHPEGGHIFLSRHRDDPMEKGVCPFHPNCLEGFASGPAVEARWGKQGALLAEDTKVWELEAYYIAQAICSYILILSPQKIVLGGGIMHQKQLLPLIRREVARQLNGYIQTRELSNLDNYIVAYSLNDNQGIMGCIKLAMDAEMDKMKKILKLTPIFQEKIWGGDRLHTVFDYDIPSSHTGECWAISGHSGGDCLVEGTELTLSQLWKQQRSLFGNLPGETFPLLIKIIDAKDDLSIQVHPDDAYAAVHENGSLGKTECWYVLDCDEGATIIIGHNAASKEEMAQMVAQNRWNELLREVPIHKGDFFQIDPGCLHAIKGGTLILETQQSSDVTYRFYDYGRLQDGKPRQLHIDKGLDVTAAPFVPTAPVQTVTRIGDAEVTRLVTCPYYSVYRAVIKGRLHRNWTQPFVNVSILEGRGTLDDIEVHRGDHLLICADYGPMEIIGEMEMLWSYI